MTRALLVYVYPRALELCLLLCASLALAQAGAIRRHLAAAGATRRGAFLLLALVMAAAALRLFALPQRHRVFYDELEHLHLAQNVASLGAYAPSLVKGPGYDALGWPPLWPAGWHVMLAQAFRLAGPTEATAYGLVAVLGACCVALGYALALLVFEAEAAALAAGAVLAFSPLCLRYSSTTDLTTASLFWCLTCLAALAHFLRERSAPALLLLGATAAYASNCRPENGLLATFALAVAAQRSSGYTRTGLGAAALASALGPLTLVFLNAPLVARVVGAEGAFALNWLTNIGANLFWLIDPRHEALPMTLLAALGIWSVPAPHKNDASVLACACLLMLAAVAMHDNGRFELSYLPHAPDRYALSLYPGLAVLAGGGAAALARWRMPAAAVMAALLLCWTPSYARVDEFPGEDAQRYETLLAAEPSLPRDLYVLSYSPGTVNFMLGRPSLSAELWLSDRPVFDEVLAKQGRGGEFVLFKDFWWRLPWMQAARLNAELRSAYDFEELWPKAGPEPEFAFYRLTPRRAGAGAAPRPGT